MKVCTDGDEHGEHAEGGVRARVDVGVPRLVDLHHAQHRQHVHERRVCTQHTRYPIAVITHTYTPM